MLSKILNQILPKIFEMHITHIERCTNSCTVMSSHAGKKKDKIGKVVVACVGPPRDQSRTNEQSTYQQPVPSLEGPTKSQDVVVIKKLVYHNNVYNSPHPKLIKILHNYVSSSQLSQDIFQDSGL